MVLGWMPVVLWEWFRDGSWCLHGVLKHTALLAATCLHLCISVLCGIHKNRASSDRPAEELWDLLMLCNQVHQHSQGTVFSGENHQCIISMPKSQDKLCSRSWSLLSPFTKALLPSPYICLQYLYQRGGLAEFSEDLSCSRPVSREHICLSRAAGGCADNHIFWIILYPSPQSQLFPDHKLNRVILRAYLYYYIYFCFPKGAF